MPTKQTAQRVLDLPGPDSVTEFPRKVFARPFRLVFERNTEGEASKITWITVETLSGLQNVTQEVAEGKLVPINAWATLDRQLWGLLAEHVGFLRYAGPAGDGHAGIQPIGAEAASLVDDMGSLFGGFGEAVDALDAMRKQIISNVTEQVNKSPRFIKDDGVNLTKNGEDLIAAEIYDISPGESLDITKDASNCEILVAESEPEAADDEEESEEDQSSD